MFAGGNKRDSNSQAVFSLDRWRLAPVGVWRPHVGQGEPGLGETSVERIFCAFPLAAGHTASSWSSDINWELPLFFLGIARIWQRQSSYWELSFVKESCLPQGHRVTGHARVQKPRYFAQTGDSSEGSRAPCGIS